MIDLFKLHDDIEDRKPYSWIVIDGPEVFINFKFLVDRIIEKSNYSIKSLSKEVSRKIGSSESMLYDILNGRTKWMSLILINNLLTILGEIGEEEEAAKVKSKFLDSIKFLKSTPRSTNVIKAAKMLSVELAELCGIHTADGSLNMSIDIETSSERELFRIKKKLSKSFSELKISKTRKKEDKHVVYFYPNQRLETKIREFLNKENLSFRIAYRLEFIDFSKSNMDYLKKLIFILFGYKAKIKSRKEEVGYYMCFSNKIIGRYLKNIFNFPLGKKSGIVDAPELIKKAPLIIRKAFIRGVMQFDGSVRINGNVALSTNSRRLLDFFLETIKRDKLKGYTWKRKGRTRELSFESSSFSERWLTYFIPKTPKYQRLYESIYGFKGKAESIEKTVKIFNRAFPRGNRSTLAISRLIREASQLRKFTRYQIVNKLNVHYKPLTVMLGILERAGIVRIVRIKMSKRFEKKSDKIIFNSNIKEWRIPLVQE